MAAEPALLAYLGLGSNLGRREAYLAAAAARLAAAGARVLRASPVYETRPQDVPAPQPDFLNAVLEVEWPGAPEELLQRALAVEELYGRVRPAGADGAARPEPAPRTLDIDLLLCAVPGDGAAGGQLLRREEPALTLPHPRLGARAFALQPLLDLLPAETAAAWLGAGAAARAAQLAAEQGVRPWGPFPQWEPDVYTPESLLPPQRLRHVGTAVRCLETTASTNDVAREWAAAGAPAGAVVVAEEQTRGRGRRGRGWHTPPGAALALSVVLRPAWPPERLTLLPLAAGVAVARAAARAAAVRCGLKWPNDVLVQGRKLAGVLVEVLGPDPAAAGVIVGIGVNLNLPRHRFPPDVRARATSLLHESGGPVARPAFARSLLAELDALLDDLDRRPEAVAGAWRALSVTLGREVEIVHGAETVRGRAVDIDAAGALIVDTGAGGRRLLAGEITG
ncbi:MAG: biotin--[acetyl-CoA-carboxylase] ligase [Firmicutes bacterium]|nr:biotin--[acetyl-CoA-carboxylase] ligase [Bacillota bacterium]